ncbi:hypothetical protein SSP531S_58660 [Streptomyces spongiicola]|uniref:Uncharacterized protein n=1 Tax=Streptomyces spongiicola TaxID=1690221 RepID=A0A388T7R5_9ACTN|nr:hypothetical protein [Streptomyces spongiicola]GBQ04372.1 hypothetical protein SSP531S_58660 [Streptomyces spongiicola]
MTLSAVTPAQIAAPLAALLPARRNIRWTIGHAPYGIRNNAPSSRLTNGRHSLIVAEEAGLIEVFADRPGLFPVHPDVVVDATDPAPALTLAARVLRSVLPDLDADAIRETARTKGWGRVLSDRAAELLELGFALIDQGAHTVPTEGVNGPGLAWTAHSGGTWGLWVYGLNRNLVLTYDGPVRGLYGFLPAVTTPYAGHGEDHAGSAFTRNLTDRLPQLRPVNDSEVQFGARREPSGWITAPTTDDPTDRADDDQRVVAEIGGLGVDLLLTTTAYLV